MPTLCQSLHMALYTWFHTSALEGRCYYPQYIREKKPELWNAPTDRDLISDNTCVQCSCFFPYLMHYMGFPGGSDSKESTCNVRELGSIPGLGRSPGGEHGNPLQYSCLENPHGQRSLVGYSPWGRKESDTTEQIWSLHSTMHCIRNKYKVTLSLPNISSIAFITYCLQSSILKLVKTYMKKKSIPLQKNHYTLQCHVTSEVNFK